VIDKVKVQIEQKLSKSFTELVPTHFRRQVVAGMIYHIRLLASEKDCENPPLLSVLHVRVFHPLFDEPLKLQAVKVAQPTDSLEVIDMDPSLL
jgi:hypothetical protein